MKKGERGDMSGGKSMDLRGTGSNAVEALTVGLQTQTLKKEWEVSRQPDNYDATWLFPR